MNPEKQRIALAKWAGWKRGDLHHGLHWQAPDGKWRQDAPDYLHDLNAVHELEDRLTDEQWASYADYTFTQTASLNCRMPLQRYMRATAAQRCEAILRALGLWEDSTPTIQPGTLRKNAL